ncbi:unnamed protein product [Gongylonema pulchrum]|uniref:Transposase n=1 Tax=Gongylonema pulchrum TaxID=637853 RepID=A0A183DLM8_9BILA|nr:unnamed protein product [Gongylonema pulchrum]
MSDTLTSLYTITPSQDINCPAYNATSYPEGGEYSVNHMDFEPKQLQRLHLWRGDKMSLFQTLYSRYSC